MEKEAALEAIKSVFVASGIRELEEYAASYEPQSGHMGMFNAKPGPRGEVLWARDIYEEGAGFPIVPVLSIPSLVEVSYTAKEDDGAVDLEILFDLGSYSMLTHQIRLCYTSYEDCDERPSSSFSIFSHATQRKSIGGEAASLMSALALGPHDENLQMSIEMQFERCLSLTGSKPSAKSLGVLERRLREDVLVGVPRSAMQYLTLALFASGEVRTAFDGEFALAKALAVEGAPVLLQGCMLDHYFFARNQETLARTLSDIDSLVIARSLGEEWPIDPILQNAHAASTDEEIAL